MLLYLQIPNVRIFRITSENFKLTPPKLKIHNYTLYMGTKRGDTKIQQKVKN